MSCYPSIEVVSKFSKCAGRAAKKLQKLTLTNLHNIRPPWLQNLHHDLNAAVFSAYGWPEPPDALEDETMLARLLALNLERAG